MRIKKIISCTIIALSIFSMTNIPKSQAYYDYTYERARYEDEYTRRTRNARTYYTREYTYRDNRDRKHYVFDEYYYDKNNNIVYSLEDYYYDYDGKKVYEIRENNVVEKNYSRYYADDITDEGNYRRTRENGHNLYSYTATYYYDGDRHYVDIEYYYDGSKKVYTIKDYYYDSKDKKRHVVDVDEKVLNDTELKDYLERYLKYRNSRYNNYYYDKKGNRIYYNSRSNKNYYYDKYGKKVYYDDYYYDSNGKKIYYNKKSEYDTSIKEELDNYRASYQRDFINRMSIIYAIGNDNYKK